MLRQLRKGVGAFYTTASSESLIQWHLDLSLKILNKTKSAGHTLNPRQFPNSMYLGPSQRHCYWKCCWGGAVGVERTFPDASSVAASNGTRQIPPLLSSSGHLFTYLNSINPSPDTTTPHPLTLNLPCISQYATMGICNFGRDRNLSLYWEENLF